MGIISESNAISNACVIDRFLYFLIMCIFFQ